MALRPAAILATEHGNAFGKWFLRLAYVNGEGVPRDLVQCRGWIVKAADGGNINAKRWLANH